METGGTVDGMRKLLHPFEIALHRSPGEPPEFPRSARTAEGGAALDQEYEQVRQQWISGDLVIIDHDHGQVIVQRRQLPQGARCAFAPTLRPPDRLCLLAGLVHRSWFSALLVGGTPVWLLPRNLISDHGRGALIRWLPSRGGALGGMELIPRY